MARISIIVMLGLSSMNIGAPETWPIFGPSLSQSSSLIGPLRMWLSGIFASAESSRIVISLLDISRLKITLVRLLWIDAARQKSSASVDLPTAGRAATITIWPPEKPLISSSRSAKPVGTPLVVPSLLEIASISSRVASMIADSGRVVLLLPLLADRVDLLLGDVDGRVDVALAGVAHLRDLGAGVDQPPQDRLLAHDRRVVAGVGRDRDAGRQRVQVRRTADPLELARDAGARPRP